MSNILALLKFQLDNKTDFFKSSSPKAMIKAILAKLVTLYLAYFVVSFALNKVLTLGFLINAEFLALVLLATQVISLVFATGTVVNTLYLNRDNELLICLPITPNQLFMSKILLIYIRELSVNAMISVPLFLTLAGFVKVGASFYLSIPVLLLILPIFPIVVASFISLPLMAAIRFLQKHTALSIIIIFSLIAVILWVYIRLIGSIANEFNIASEQYETMLKVNKIIARIGVRIVGYYQLAGAMLSFSKWYVFLLYVLICTAISAVAVAFTRYSFFKLAMVSLENTVKAKRKVKEFKRRSIFSTLLLKEFFCVFRSFSEVFEYFLFTLLMPFIVICYDRILMTVSVNQAGVNMISGAHLMVVAILAMLSNISSASAISRDGGNFYMSKTVPIDFFTQMFVKFSFNAIFTLGAIILTAAISFFTYPAWQILLGSLAVAMASLGHIAYCIDSDVKNPTISHQGNEETSTVSKSTPKCLIYGLVIAFIMGLTVILLSRMENQVIPYLIIIGFSLVFMIYRIYTMILRINLCYEKIEM